MLMSKNVNNDVSKDSSIGSLKGALASTTAAATTTPQIKNLIGRVRKKISVLHVQHVHTNKSVLSSAKQQHEITTFTVLMTT